MTARQRTRRKRIVKGMGYAEGRKCGARLGELKCGVLRVHHDDTERMHIDFRSGRDYATWSMVPTPAPAPEPERPVGIYSDTFTAETVNWSGLDLNQAAALAVTNVPAETASLMTGGLLPKRSRWERLVDWFRPKGRPE